MSYGPNFLGELLGLGGRSDSSDPQNTDGSNVDVGGCVGSEIIASRCKEVFDEDQTVLRVVGLDGVELWDTRPFQDFRDGPLLYISPSTTTDEPVPNRMSLTEVELFFGVRYPFGFFGPRKAWEPGIASFVGHLKTLLSQDLNTVEFYIGDQCVQTARSSEPGTFAPFVDANPDRTRFAITHEFSWTWKIRLDNATGLPIDVAHAVALL